MSIAVRLGKPVPAFTPAADWVGRRTYLQNTIGTHNKFYQVDFAYSASRNQSLVHRRWGKIGTKGSGDRHGKPGDSLPFITNLIASKVREGYVVIHDRPMTPDAIAAFLEEFQGFLMDPAQDAPEGLFACQPFEELLTSFRQSVDGDDLVRAVTLRKTIERELRQVRSQLDRYDGELEILDLLLGQKVR